MLLSRLVIGAFLAGLACLPGQVLAAEGPLDQAPIDPTDAASLQAGARTFVNYCLNCHSASLVRYSALKGIGLTEDQIKQNLLFAGTKVGDMMKVAANPKDQKAWFGNAPPDLSVEARARGADWLYSYLRGFYRDSATVTGWNNTVFPNVAMPHVLWQLQGVRQASTETVAGEEGGKKTELVLQPAQGGQMNAAQYDKLVADLVNYMVWMAEPHALERHQVGYIALIGIAILILLTYLLKAAFWRDVH
jgi:ubiquinol-cytochrome c reductase cytochrome c1 subunit